MAARGREAQRLGRTLRDEPRSFPREVAGLARRSVRTVWRARGGGLYACGFVVTFVILEIRMFIGDIAGADSVGSFFAEQVFEMFFRYLGESFVNTLYAFAWPVFVIDYKPPWGLAGLVIAFVVFDRFLKETVGSWLFGEETDIDDSSPPHPPD